MPLHECIHDPIAQEIVHNGATFQVDKFAVSFSIMKIIYFFFFVRLSELTVKRSL